MHSSKTYREFLDRKHVRQQRTGFTVADGDINARLFPWQREIVRWACKCGRAALFEDCGLGKTLQQLEWGRLVCEFTGGNVLLLCPLAVQWQTKREAEKFGVDARVGVNVVESQAAVQPGISIVNYEKLHHFDTSSFVGVVLDESSILKAYTGATKRALCQQFASTPYRLACTATPAPNDRMELGNHSEFLGVMPSDDMLARWFINDGGKAGTYRLRKHGERDFWRWMASWSVCISMPSDIGFPDDGFVLPELRTVEHVIDSKPESGYLFAVPRQVSATDVHREKRAYLAERAEAVAEIVNKDDDCWAVWCDTDYEADALRERIPDSVEVRGSDSQRYKESSIEWFLGNICLCHLMSIRRGAKLAACGKRSMQRGGGGSTALTHPSESEGSGRGGRRNETANTCSRTTRKTSRSGDSPKSSGKSVTPSEESGTQKIVSTERNARLLQKEDQAKAGEIQSLEKTSESRRKSTTRCLPIKMASVQSADQLQRTNEITDSTLTTATSREGSGESCAETATLGSANSKTISTSSRPHICTCGGIKTHRVLISKPEIFGLGLNFQHCHKTTWFAGYSYERFYQAIRRLWRFGQQYPVEVHLVRTVNEGSIAEAIERKKKQHAEMQREMASLMAEGMKEELGFGNQPRRYVAERRGSVPAWLKRKTIEMEAVA